MSIQLHAQFDPSGKMIVTDQDGRVVDLVTAVSFRQVWNQHTPMSKGESHGMGFLTVELLVKAPK